MKTVFKISCIILLGLFIASCKKNEKKHQVEKVVKEWTGKTIQFPQNMRYVWMGKDTIGIDLLNKEYKILVYVDSSGCTSCKLRLPYWKNLIKEADSIAPGQIGFLFFFNPKNEKELGFILKRDQLEYPVVVDRKDEINRLNHFPVGDMMLQSFLLDRNNKVLLVGNPAQNPKMWELYKQLITGEQKKESTPETTVSVERATIELQDLHVGKTTKAGFILHNTGETALQINDVKTSCGCTVPSWKKYPIEPGGQTTIDVEITPEEAGYFQKSIDVFCNVKERIVKLTITGTVK